jgi:hypothetical protein
MYLQHDSLYQEDIKEYGERHQAAHLSSLIIGMGAGTSDALVAHHGFANLPMLCRV